MEATAQQQPTPAPHTGLLREENTILRHIFGYRDNFSTDYLMPDVLGVKLGKTTLSDARFLCVDIDSIQEKEGVIQQLHIGVSLLDTRSLQRSISRSPRGKPKAPMIESHHFVVGSPKFAQGKSNKFLFGPLETMSSVPDLRARLGPTPLHRNIILVCHGGTGSLRPSRLLALILVRFVSSIQLKPHSIRCGCHIDTARKGRLTSLGFRSATFILPTTMVRVVLV